MLLLKSSWEPKGFINVFLCSVRLRRNINPVYISHVKNPPNPHSITMLINTMVWGLWQSSKMTMVHTQHPTPEEIKGTNHVTKMAAEWYARYARRSWFFSFLPPLHIQPPYGRRWDVEHGQKWFIPVGTRVSRWRDSTRRLLFQMSTTSRSVLSVVEIYFGISIFFSSLLFVFTEFVKSRRNIFRVHVT